MVPQDARHAILTRWMRKEDPVFQFRVESAPFGAEIIEADGLYMIYAHKVDRSCCEITKVNPGEGPMYARDADGRLIRGG